MAMKGGPSGLFLLLLIRSLSGLGTVVTKQYLYIAVHLSWHDAQSFCRRHTTDLAVIDTQSDADVMLMKYYKAWIGLSRPDGAAESDSALWTWSNGQTNISQTWAYMEPQDGDNCAFAFYSSNRFRSNHCGAYFFFICHKIKPNTWDYIFIPQSKTWPEARQHCRNEFDDLATFRSFEELWSNVDQRDFPVWTGLHRDGQTWKWSSGSSAYRRWAPNEPGNDGNCVSISSLSKDMAVHHCSTRLPFICFKDNLILVEEKKDWEEALEHCRSLGYELVSVQPGLEHQHVMMKVMQANTEKVWTGLCFLAGEWLWVNGAQVSYSDLPLCPFQGKRCGALTKKDSGSMEATDCLERLNFLCYT